MSTPRRLTLPANARAASWPARHGHRRVIVHRPPAAREWFLLVPGFTGSKEDFLELLEPLAAAGFAVVAFDQLGQYQSSAAPSEEAYALVRLAEDLCSLATHARAALALPSRGHIVGHSFGGLVVQVAAGLPSFEADSVTLLCSGPGALPANRRTVLPVLIEALPAMSLQALWDLKCVWERERGVPEPAHDVMVFCERRWLANDPVGLRAMARLLCDTPEVDAALAARAAAGMPVQVIWGSADDAWPVAEQSAMAARLGASATALAGCGHSPHVEDPHRLVRELVAARSRWPGTAARV